MRKLTLLLLAALMVITFGCKIEAVGNVESVAVLAEIAALNIGCEVAKGDRAAVDQALRNIYLSIESGGVTPNTTMQLSQLMKSHPTLAPSIAKLTKLYRIDFKGESGAAKVITDPKIFEAIGSGYVEGFNMCSKKS